MSEQFIPFPSIEQYRNVVKSVETRCKYHGESLPVLRFHGTVKLHGTNASVLYDTGSNTFWAQSRNNIITPEKDNEGFARFAYEHREQLIELARVLGEYSTRMLTPLIAIYGEWCGQGILGGTAIAKLPKMFVIFGARVVTPEMITELKDGQELGGWVSAPELMGAWAQWRESNLGVENVRCIEAFRTYETLIDMANPGLKSNDLGALTLEVEQRCPVAYELGVDGVGEGIVWRCVGRADDKDSKVQLWDLVFKVKGEKHSDSKVKTLAPVDVEKLNSVKEFVERVITDHRLEKGLAYLKEMQLELIDRSTGAFVKWVVGDVFKEEADVLEASGLAQKDVGGALSKAASQWYLKKLQP